MRHNIAHRKLGRTTSHRKALFRNMLSALVARDRIETTLAKARELRPLADKLITLAKEGTLSARRFAFSALRDETAVKKLFSALVERFGDRKGGYTRILKLGFRHGDSAPMAILEYLTAEIKKVAGETKSKASKKVKKAPSKK
ncbi:MAG: 50S ribosomal protein L17 [Deltaproteobacteria bacterium RIFCSPLOWO2_02_FULL_47_10]|nr:MAG: 50S ribosomal protein L17 [Deltaproteobacteria bacterium RIFCSPLOWO2_02_FULL_47_10]